MRPVLLEGVRRQGAEMEKRRKTVKPTDLGKLWKRRMDALSMDRGVLSTSSRTEPSSFPVENSSDWSSSGSNHENPETAEAGSCSRLGNIQ